MSAKTSDRTVKPQDLLPDACGFVSAIQVRFRSIVHIY